MKVKTVSLPTVVDVGVHAAALAGAGIETNKPEVKTFVTLSPKTEMARRFHHKNGAETYRENADTVNYLYR